MRLTIFAATGGIGFQALRQALAAGHDVTAVVRNPARLAAGLASLPAGTAQPPKVRTVTADLAAPDPAVLAAAVEGADAVLSGLGPRSMSDTGIVSRGTRAITGAMHAAHARRIVAVSAAPISTVASPGRPAPPKHDPGDGFFLRHLLSPLIKTLLNKPYADLALMEDILRDSGLDWTVVRPPRLTGKALTGTYRTALGQNVRRGVLVSRADVADLMLRVLGQPETIKQAVGIAN